LRKEVIDWLASSDYDIESAGFMFQSGRYSWCVFMCHQAVEKLLKALIIYKKKEFPPRIHNIKMLYENTGIEQNDCIDTILLKLSPHYMLSRYPDVAGGPSHSMYNKCMAEELYKDTKKVLQWLKQKLQ